MFATTAAERGHRVTFLHRADAAACLRNASLWNARQQPPKQPTHDRYAQSRGGGCR
mgnify:CR=1 FL=1